VLEHLTLAERIFGGIAVVLGSLGLIYGYVAKIKPRIGKVIDVWTALVELLFGKAAEPPNPITGAPAVPEVLGMGPRLTAQETTTALLVKNVALLTEQQARNDEVVRQLVDLRHEVGLMRSRLDVLEEARAERVVAQAESAAMWSAVAANAQNEHGTEHHDQPAPTMPEIPQEKP
jgi:hypothetical protein